ncbi:MAG TPA: DinB family protein, partial [Gemmatales bacterium]|nr:DinB family protein [Gemmatales bacterium]
MFTKPQDAIAYSLRTSQKLFHRYVDDLLPEEFQHRPCLGANNALWIMGHLTAVDRAQLERLGVTELPSLPEGFV